jgi:ribosome-associated toxin RatA of RatAB toxin-antitoxin module
MEVRKTVLVTHSARQMFDLIEAAEHYPAFLPWCAAATIVERDDSVVRADVTVDYHGVRFHFRTRNPKRAPEWMAIHLEHGPFHHFEGEWQLTPLGTEGCRVQFLLRYEFKRSITSRLAGPVFDRITNTMVDAFVQRADRVYAGVPAGEPAAMVPPATVEPAPDATPGSTAQAAVPPPSGAPGPVPAGPSIPAAAGGDPTRSES